MEIKAELKYLRIAPRKVRSVVDLIRNKEIREAESQLKFVFRKAADPVLKLLKSAVANAKNNFGVDKENLFIKEIKVNEGVPYKRWRPMSRGRAYPIMKRTSHILICLGIKEGVKIEKPKASQSTVNKQAEELSSENTTEKINKVPAKTANKKPEKESIKPQKQNWAKRIFRRKSI